MVTPSERMRAGRAVEVRMAERLLTRSIVARRAQVDPKTLAALITGERWPRVGTRARIERALGWPAGEIDRRARNGLSASDLARFSELDLLAELQRRAEERVQITQLTR